MALGQEKAESGSDPSATLMKHISRLCHGEIQKRAEIQNTKISSCCEETSSSDHTQYRAFISVIISFNHKKGFSLYPTIQCI